MCIELDCGRVGRVEATVPSDVRREPDEIATPDSFRPYLDRYRLDWDETFTVGKRRLSAFQRCPASTVSTGRKPVQKDRKPYKRS